MPELVALGANFVREKHDEEVLGHVVMRDSEDNELCVAGPFRAEPGFVTLPGGRRRWPT